ncbi:tetratricopeptide repeat protein [Spongiibacter taiwanensis]|uniref:tetratricopeptide repeat protein n=1 Tax=Spongiibacter taiwanensis TaxID=1748242 RepID=UPI002035EE40|nr:tetratricopeptide repeat protein [Spongiibacter taiwanensis]USA44337.1 tetratricopeptide repeat protein [Spongiibacter taiwanensis]
MRFVFASIALTWALLSGCASTAPVAEETPPTQPQVSDEAAPARAFPEDTFLDLLVAEFAMRQHDFGTALDNYAYQAKQTQDPGVVSTATRLAQFMGRDDSTLSLAQQWVALEPDNIEALFTLASQLAKQDRPLEALPYMTQVQALGGESNFAALAATALSLPAAERDAFFAELDGVAKRYPDESSIQIATALKLQYEEREEQALALVRKVLSKDPDNTHALLIETRTLAQMGRDKEARERLRYAVDQNPDNKRLRHDLARNLVSDNVYEAKAQYEVLVSQNPGDEDLLLELMLINRELEYADEADAQLAKLENNSDNSSRVNYILGRVAEEDRDWQQAIGHYAKVTGAPEFAIAARRLTAISLATEGEEATLNRLRKMLDHYPQHTEELTLLAAEVLRKTAQYQEGMALLNRAITSLPDSNDLRYSRSLFAEQLGNLSLVESDLRYILAKEPDNAAALNALGYTLANHTDRLDEAEALVKKALAVEPEDAAIIDSYGWIQFRRGNIEEAVTHLDRAFRKVQDHEIAAHLGEALWLLGEKDRARQVFQQGLQDTPDSPIILDTLQRLNLIDDVNE